MLSYSLAFTQKILQSSKACKTRYKKTKDQKYRNYNIPVVFPQQYCMYACTMLLEQIKGFYHGITYQLVVIPCLAGICKDVYIVIHVRTDCGIQIKQHTKLYTQMVQGLANYAQKLCKPDPSLTLQRTVGRCQTTRMPSCILCY